MPDGAQAFSYSRKRKRADDDTSSPRPRKRQMFTKPDLRHEDPFYNDPAGPRYIGRKAMLAVRAHIVRLTKKEWDTKTDVQELRSEFIKLLWGSYVTLLC